MDFGITIKKQEELEKRMAALNIRESDIEEKFVRSSGPGGQKVNKTASCVYIRHIPTSLEVKSSRERSQGLNRYYARKRLCELIENQQLGKESPEALKVQKIRKQKQRRKRRSRNSQSLMQET
jgi:peptide chain release factor